MSQVDRGVTVLETVSWLAGTDHHTAQQPNRETGVSGEAVRKNALDELAALGIVPSVVVFLQKCAEDKQPGSRINGVK